MFVSSVEQVLISSTTRNKKQTCKSCYFVIFETAWTTISHRLSMSPTAWTTDWSNDLHISIIEWFKRSRATWQPDKHRYTCWRHSGQRGRI